MKSNLYTGTGDNGTTSLVGGQRVSKTCIRLDSYGTIDEFSSFLGVAAACPQCPAELLSKFEHIQNRLFDVGCYLATAVEGDNRPLCNATDEREIRQLETWIDETDSLCPVIRAFVLPGGSVAGAHCHVARAVCRRAERRILELAASEFVDPLLLRWLNRLSDFLFIAARYCNVAAGVEEITWKPASHL